MFVTIRPLFGFAFFPLFADSQDTCTLYRFYISYPARNRWDTHRWFKIFAMCPTFAHLMIPHLVPLLKIQTLLANA